MTTNERRIAAYMRFHGYTRKEAEAVVRAKPNPTSAPKAAKKRLSKKRYVSRPSQAGEQRAPTARLKARRKANLNAPKGVFPNPLKQRKCWYVKVRGQKISKKMCGTSTYGAYDAVRDFAHLKYPEYRVIPSQKYVGNAFVFEAHNNDYGMFFLASETPFAKQNPLKPGITARPRKGASTVSRKMLSVDHAKSESGPWTIAGIFPNRQLAADYAKAMAELNPRLWWRVATL